MVYHETSTGMANPVAEVGALCEKYGKLYFADCVSAAGGEHVNAPKNKIGVATSVGGKCVGAFPGSAYVCARRDILENIPADQCRNVYLSLAKHYAEAKSHSQTPNTPNVTLFWALNAALANIESEGLEERIGRYKACAGIIRKGLKKMGLELLIPESQMSNTVTTALLPKGIALDVFIRKAETAGYTLYEGKGPLKEKRAFQIANMGEIYEDDCRRFVEVLKSILASCLD
jgi:2-aminoethylphosphonate-pyruvate transaminase